MPDLDSRERVEALVAAFYDRALHDDLLGPVFAAAGLDLPTHLPRIAAFWERTLLDSGSYAGRPRQVHRQLVVQHHLGERHFARWLQLWQQTLAERFSGPLADQAVAHAGRMAEAVLDPGAGENGLPLV